jgi:putative ABC transport system ATP-binding protein
MTNSDPSGTRPQVVTAASVVSMVEVDRIFRSHGDVVRAVDGVSLELVNGELVGVVGPSGSGKTTLLHLVMGWEEPDLGTVTRRADVVADWTGAAIVSQGLGLLPELTALENVELAVRLSGAAGVSAIELLAELDLEDLANRLPAELSLGEQQRVAIARAVSCRPILLVADEPTSHQDEARADRTMAMLRRVAEQGGAVLVATHDERVLASMDRTLRMEDGNLR